MNELIADVQYFQDLCPEFDRGVHNSSTDISGGGLGCQFRTLHDVANLPL
jgi:hypothetical protein